MSYAFAHGPPVTGLLYDRFGRVKTKNLYTSAAFAAGTPTQTIGFRYDEHGRTTEIIEERGTTTQGYDLDGRLVQVVSPEGTVGYDYDPATGRLRKTFTANSEIQYQHDAVGRLSQVRVAKRDGAVLTAPEITRYGYDAANNLVRTELPNGVVTQQTFDQRDRAKLIVHKDALGQVLASFDYRRRANGQIEHVDESLLGPGGTVATQAIDFFYDALSRLTREAHSPSLGAIFAIDYLLDTVGNRLEKKTTNADGSVERVAGAFDANDQLRTETRSLRAASASTFTVLDTTTYGYDPNGSQISKVVQDSAGNALSSATFGYNLENRLSSAQILRAEGGQPVQIDTTYTYNQDGVRVAESVGRSVAGGPATTDSTLWLVDRNSPTGYAQVLEELTPGGVLKASFVYGLAPISQFRAGALSFYLADHHSGVRLLTSPSGALIDRYFYDAFGNLVVPTTPMVANPLLYRGERFDPQLQQYYLRARYYDPATGTFNRLDPERGELLRPSSLHRFGYVSGDPANRVDPTGRFEGIAGLMAGLSVRLTVFAISHPVLARAFGLAVNLLLPAEFHEAMIGSGIPPFRIAGSTGAAGGGFLRTVLASKNPLFTRFVQRWNRSASGTLGREVGLAFEEFFHQFLPGAKRNEATNVGAHRFDYLWHGWALEIKSGLSVDRAQLAAIAQYARVNGVTFVYYFLRRPPDGEIGAIQRAGGHVVHLY